MTDGIDFQMDAADLRHLTSLESRGWAATGVFDPDNEHPPWLYTSGLTAFGSPELVIVGVDPRQGHQVVAPTADKVVTSRGEYHPEPGRDDSVLVDYTAWWLPVEDPNSEEFPLSMALRFRRGREVTALQLVLPDVNNRLPWESGFDTHWGRHQILLGPAPTTEDEE